MQRFFESIADIHHFSHGLRWNQQELRCQHCHKQDQWVSHGFTYKQHTLGRAEPVGKRILCSNRFGRSGCGRTIQLYCAHWAPYLHYSLYCCFAFLICLLADKAPSVDAAYRHATGAQDTRNAWRWLNRLSVKISAFRTFLFCVEPRDKPVPDNTISPLLSTVKQLITLFSSDTCQRFQLKTQSAFI